MQTRPITHTLTHTSSVSSHIMTHDTHTTTLLNIVAFQENLGGLTGILES